MDIPGFLFSGWASLVRILVVGAPAYLALVLMLRFAGKHSLAKTNAYGLAVTVALGSSLASAVLTKEVSLADGVAAVALLLSLQYLLAFLLSRTGWSDRWITQRPTLLLKDGHLLRDALRRERVTEAEVRAAVRQSGLASLEHVAAVVIEADGSFSVIAELGGSGSAMLDVTEPETS
jgi:uncharacterized membrane protein YcaP (DUF421 family)